MGSEHPTHAGFWWFAGTFRGRPFNAPVQYDGNSRIGVIDIIGCDEIFRLADFVGEYSPICEHSEECWPCRRDRALASLDDED